MSMRNQSMTKTFVGVTAAHDTLGKITPLSITWEDGRVFTIDKVMDVRMAASLKAGGQGMRYGAGYAGRLSTCSTKKTESDISNVDLKFNMTAKEGFLRFLWKFGRCIQCK